MRTFIIGDIHGCYDELRELLDKAGLQDKDLLISLGDLVDRGGKSLEVYRYFRDRPNTITLIGNHERKHINGVLSYAQEIVKVQFGEEYNAFLNWLSTLGYYYETDLAIIVHAALEDGKPLHEQKEEVLCGSTAGERYLEKRYGDEFTWREHYRGQKPVIYGHRVVGNAPKIENNTYGIDTGCCHGGYLTAVELPGFIIHQVKSHGDYWKKEQRRWQIPVLEARDWLNMDFPSIRKLLDKLSYVQEEETKKYLAGKEQWLSEMEDSFDAVKTELANFTVKLMEEHPDDFNRVAAQYEFKTMLFKSRAGSLTVEDIRKSIDTPGKLLKLREKLG